ncbi:MAG: hypothetical protein CMN85_03635 [Spongiibacteraceae bacterium]|nr:hypothetical protein [Spongiibacteraceae bacterium]
MKCLFSRAQGLSLAAVILLSLPLTEAAYSEPECADSEAYPRLEAIAAHLQFYDSAGPHRSGTVGDIKTAQYLSQQLSALGYDVRRQNFTVPDHGRLQANVSTGNEQIALLVQPPVSERRIFKGPLVYWHYRPGISIPDPTEKSILLVELSDARYSSYQSFPIRKLRAQLVDKGSDVSAVILITNGATQEAQLLNIDPAETFLPTFIVAPRDAAPLREAANRQQRVALESLASTGELQASNVIASRILPGRPHWIISTPTSGWGHSVGERGPGFAAFLEMAAWAKCALADYSLQFVANSGHELENMGSKKYLNELAPKPFEVELWLHLGAGWGARDYLDIGPRLLPLNHANPYSVLMMSEAIKPALSPRFKALPGLANAYTFADGKAAGELQEIHHLGYNAIGLFGAHQYHHVASDRLDKTHADLVAPVVSALQDTLLRYKSR